MDEELTSIQDTVHRAVIKLSPRQRHKACKKALKLEIECLHSVWLQYTVTVAAGATNEDTGSSNVAKDLRDVIEQMAVLENERKVRTVTHTCSHRHTHTCSHRHTHTCSHHHTHTCSHHHTHICSHHHTHTVTLTHAHTITLTLSHSHINRCF